MFLRITTMVPGTTDVSFGYFLLDSCTVGLFSVSRKPDSHQARRYPGRKFSDEVFAGLTPYVARVFSYILQTGLT